MPNKIESTNQLLQDLHDSVSCIVDDTAEQIGVTNTCPHCCANYLLDEHKTQLLSDLYRLGKEDPQLLFAEMVAELLYSQAYAHLIENVLKETVELFREELEEEEEDED